MFDKKNVGTEVESEKVTKYVGTGVFEFVGVNLNKEQLNELGIRVKVDPVFVAPSFKEGIPQGQINIVYKFVPQQGSKIEPFYISNKFVVQDNVHESEAGNIRVHSGYSSNLTSMRPTMWCAHNDEAIEKTYNELISDTRYDASVVDVSELKKLRIGEEEFINVLTNIFGFAWRTTNTTKVKNSDGSEEEKKITTYNQFGVNDDYEKNWKKACKGDMTWLVPLLKEMDIVDKSIIFNIHTNANGYMSVTKSYYSRGDINYFSNYMKTRLDKDDWLKSNSLELEGGLMREATEVSIKDAVESKNKTIKKTNISDINNI